jgi:hypothetical protein
MIAVHKLPARYAPVVMPLILSVLMPFVVSTIPTLRSLGPTSGFLAAWPGGWGLSRLVAFPTLLAVLRLVRRIVALLVAPPSLKADDSRTLAAVVVCYFSPMRPTRTKATVLTVMLSDSRTNPSPSASASSPLLVSSAIAVVMVRV